MNLDKVITGYIEAALWTSGADKLEYGASDMTKKSRIQTNNDCREFLEKAANLLKDCKATEERVGHDFWLSRNGEGSGFFDGEYWYGVNYCKALQDVARKFGERSVMLCRSKFDIC